MMDECKAIGHEKIVITHALEFNVYQEPLRSIRSTIWLNAAPTSNTSRSLACPHSGSPCLRGDDPCDKARWRRSLRSWNRLWCFVESAAN